jgi:hypothetical protein
MVKFFVGLDLGQSQDYTALCVIEAVSSKGKEGATYHVRHLERIRGESYPSIAEKVTAIMRSSALAGKSVLVVDGTGCGRPVFDMFEKASLKPIGVYIHGGDAVTHDGNIWRVPKRDLVGVLQVMLQTGRLKVSSKLKLAPILQSEMLNFKVKIDPATAHDSYSAWREADHDDLVLSVALACWYAETAAPKPMPILIFPRPTPDQLRTQPWRISSYVSRF